MFQTSMAESARTVVLLQVLQENLSVLIENINSDCEAGDSEKESVLGKAAELFNLLEKAADDVGQYDIRRVSGRKLIGEIETFYAEVSAFDIMKNNNKNKSVLKLFFKNIESIDKSINEPWNTDLPVDEQFEDGEHRNEEKDQVNLPSDPIPKEQLATPKGRVVSMFEKFTPLTKQVVVEDCGVCHVKFTHPKSRENHYRKNHPEVDVPIAPKSKGTCKLPDKSKPAQRCGKMFTSDQINRHLKVRYNNYHFD